MKIGFIGNFARGYVGEQADEVHISNEIENLGHTVYRIPRDEWREHVKQRLKYVNVPEGITFDAVIICKWHHFYDGSFIDRAREEYKCPVFYFVWDYMADSNYKFPDWHIKMVQASDKYLGNDVRLTFAYEDAGVPSQKLYYFPFDVADKNIAVFEDEEKIYPVTFFGSYFGAGDRIEWLRAINNIFPVKIFASNYEEWNKAGFTDAEPAVYGDDFSEKVAQSNIILGFNVNDHCWGYWSNRVGKVLTTGGFLLQRYVPGMELFLRDGAAYFSSTDEAIAKIKYYLDNPKEAIDIASIGFMIGRQRFTSEERIKDLMIFIDRYLNGAF
jgi:hypothetical protein